MTLAQSLSISWICTCVFMVLISLKLENRGQYLWFVVFIPRYIICFIDIVWLIVRIVKHVRNYQNPQDVSMKRKVWYIHVSVLEILFEILVCLRLDGIASIKLYFAFIPLWILLIGQMVNYFHFQILVVRT
uniref:transmembrane protein 60-like n=1 Tax=Styela clava TaxID=7725 RepID=UPI00193935F8|nr:transmembrane protein 60-like [Styela clava]